MNTSIVGGVGLGIGSLYMSPGVSHTDADKAEVATAAVYSELPHHGQVYITIRIGFGGHII